MKPYGVPRHWLACEIMCWDRYNRLASHRKWVRIAHKMARARFKQQLRRELKELD